MTAKSSPRLDVLSLLLDWSRSLFLHNHGFLCDRLICLDHGIGVESVVGGFLVLLDPTAS